MTEGKAIKGLKASLEAAANPPDEEVEAEFTYRIVLKSGIPLEIGSNHEPDVLAKLWKKARDANEVIAWNDAQFSDAREIAHLEPALEDADEEEEEEKKDAGATEGAGARGGDGAPIGLSATVTAAGTGGAA